MKIIQKCVITEFYGQLHSQLDSDVSVNVPLLDYNSRVTRYSSTSNSITLPLQFVNFVRYFNRIQLLLIIW